MALSLGLELGTPLRSHVACTSGLRLPHSRAAFLACPRRRRFSFRVYADEKMYVPGDSFGGKSPEVYFAERMKAFFTFIAVK
jgi:hypothetical protein